MMGLLMRREVLIGIVLGFAVAWVWHQFAVPSMGVPAMPLISYAPNQSARDWKGVPFNMTNPGR